jgi:hypothetical protein
MKFAKSGGLTQRRVRSLSLLQLELRIDNHPAAGNHLIVDPELPHRRPILVLLRAVSRRAGVDREPRFSVGESHVESRIFNFACRFLPEFATPQLE